MKRSALIVIGVVVILALILVVKSIGTYNELVKLDQAVESQWAQVQNVYQRRAGELHRPRRCFSG